MRLLFFIAMSSALLYAGLSMGFPAQVGAILGIAWTLTMISVSGIPLRWLMDLMRKIEAQGGSIFSRK